MSKFSIGQITVAPVSIHMNDADKNGYLVLRNNSTTTPWEVAIEIKYGYPKSDSLGNTFIYFPEDSTITNSAVPWISFFPRKFILDPQSEQTVRIIAKPPKDLPDGEYWGRPSIKSQAVQSTDTSNNEVISVGLSTIFQTVIALNYRKGKVNTGLDFEDLSAVSDSDKITAFAKISRTGNCAYLGMMSVKAFSSSNEIIAEFQNEIAVYYDLNRKIDITIPENVTGIVTVEVSFNTNREEPGAQIIKGNSVSKRVTVEIKR